MHIRETHTTREHTEDGDYGIKIFDIMLASEQRMEGVLKWRVDNDTTSLVIDGCYISTLPSYTQAYELMLSRARALETVKTLCEIVLPAK